MHPFAERVGAAPYIDHAIIIVQNKYQHSYRANIGLILEWRFEKVS
jgi:hypothetical protein